VTYTNANGVELQGRLLYPANYEPGKQYPMIVYIYELRSQSLHSYTVPTRTSAYNQRRFSSEGYFVFEPDIVYRLRDPGMSAVECIVPAVEEVLETGMVDAGRVGLTGHSWGAYQTAFVVTQTDLFSAAVAGAPLTNMISMYNSMYWNSGSTDAQIFEISQGRFPKPYWEDWDKFVQNSPIFNAQRSWRRSRPGRRSACRGISARGTRSRFAPRTASSAAASGNR
jgi:dipeptidyl aminopeptidase/acylaminoacyl peptidase